MFATEPTWTVARPPPAKIIVQLPGVGPFAWPATVAGLMNTPQKYALASATDP